MRLRCTVHLPSALRCVDDIGALLPLRSTCQASAASDPERSEWVDSCEARHTIAPSSLTNGACALAHANVRASASAFTSLPEPCPQLSLAHSRVGRSALRSSLGANALPPSASQFRPISRVSDDQLRALRSGSIPTSGLLLYNEGSHRGSAGEHAMLNTAFVGFPPRGGFLHPSGALGR